MIALKTKSTISDIWEQIRSALQKRETTSGEIENLLDQTKDEADSVAECLAEAKLKSQDLLLSQADSDAAWLEYERLSREFQRLTSAIEQLEERYKLALANEDAERKLSRYRDVEEKRNVVAARIKAEYPDIQKKLVSMIEDILKVSVEIEAVNLSLPEGCSRLDRPEGVAFGIPDGGPLGVHADGNGEFNRICRMIVPDHKNPMVAAWPPAFSRMADRRTPFNVLLSKARHGEPN